jgi:arginine-tRNA-protein transferase
MKKGLPQCDDQRLLLFNRHNQERALDVRRQGPADVEEYRTFLVESICQTMEWTFWLEDELVAVSTVDYGATGLSAVYCYFNPDHGSLSLGTYSILKLFQFAEETGRTYVYLGLYVAENRHLKYKSRFVPQERRVKYKWIPFANAPGNETE